jgi:hypothetical protein
MLYYSLACPHEGASAPGFSYAWVRMKSFLKLGSAFALSCLAVETAARAVGYSPREWIKPYRREALQDIVSSDIV